MSASPSVIQAPVHEKKSLARRFVSWLIWTAVLVLLLFGAAIINNNYSLHKRSRAEFNAQLDRAIESSTQWIVTHPESYGNPPLMFMVGDMAEMSRDPRLERFVDGYLARSWVNVPGRPITSYYAHWAKPASPVLDLGPWELQHVIRQDRWFAYASAPAHVDFSAPEHDALFSPTKFHWGIRLHLQLLALDMYRRFNGTSSELDGVLGPVTQGVARDAYWDFRVNDAYYQRAACILGAGRADLIRSRWIDRILDYQNADGTWNYCWHGWCRGVLEINFSQEDHGHSTVQAAWALYQLKYRYSDWIAKNYK